MHSKIYKEKLPEKSLAAFSFSEIHYADVFACDFSSNNKITVDDVVRSFFETAPNWVRGLLKMRNKIVKTFGLKTGTNNIVSIDTIEIKKGNTIGLFKIIDRTENEVLMGEDDKHLNFRVSVILQEIANKNYKIIITTVVHYNNIFGKLYFIPVKPMHKIIVPAMMRKMTKSLYA